MDRESWISRSLEDLREEGLYRSLATCPAAGGVIRDGDRTILNFSSNDYLDLARHPAVTAAARNALETYGAGSTASRLVTGTLPLHEELEREIARLKGCASALVFGSGYLANAAIIPALAGRGHAVFADRLAHASLIDSVALSRAELHRFRHNDPAHLDDLLAKHDAPRRLVVTESVFSMDGDLAPLREIAEICRLRGALLMVDEAHATGVCGPGGAGLIAALGVTGDVNVSMGTLSKALGGYGGFAAGSVPMRELLVNRGRAFIYSTALPPPAAGAALGALQVLRDSPGLGAELLRRASIFRTRLRDGGLDTMSSQTQIIPVFAGTNEKALALAARLRARHILAVAIRPPTVPPGSARIRLSVTLAHTEDQLHAAADAILAAAREEGLA